VPRIVKKHVEAARSVLCNHRSKLVVKNTIEYSHSPDYGGHKWQLPNETVLKLLHKAGFTEVNFHKIKFPSIRMDRDRKKRKWKIFLNRYLPK